MIRLNVGFFYDLGKKMHPLSELQPDDKIIEVLGSLYAARAAVQGLLDSHFLAPAIRSSIGPGTQLVTAIDNVTNNTDLQQLLGIEPFNISNALNTFEGALTAELTVAEAYFVSRKAGYDSSVLTQQGELMFPLAMGEKVPEAVADAKEASKCLAFELPTACGFHSMRTVESVLRKYWDRVMEGEERPKQNNMGDFLREFEKRGTGDKKVRAALKQIKDLHRNPLVHPEVILSVEEAVALFGIAVSAITAMLQVIPPSSGPVSPDAT